MHEGLSRQSLQRQTAALERQVAAITAAARSVLGIQGFEPTARAIFDVCKSAIGATAGYVALLAEDGSENEVLFLDAGGLPCSVDPDLPMPIRGLRAQVNRDAQAVFDNQFSTGPWAEYLPAGHVELKNVLFAPLIIDDAVVGLLGLANKPADFSAEDAFLASILGGLAAMALRQARAEDRRRRAEISLAVSEEMFRRLFEAMNEGVCLHEIIYDNAGTAADYRIIDVNPAYERITGLARKAALGALASEIYGTGRPPFLETYAQVAETGKPQRFEVHWPPMGKHFLINVFSPAKGRFATVFTDITDNKVKEEALRKNSQHLSITLNAIGDAVISTDAEGRIALMNPIAEQLTGWSLAEARGRHLDQVFVIVNEHTRQTVENPVTKVLRDNAVVGLANHTVLIARDGSEYFIDDSGAPIRDAGGAIVGIVLIFRDVTAKRHAERSLRDSEEELSAIYDNAPVIMLLLDDQRRIRKANRFAGAFTDRLEPEMTGLSGGEALRCLYALDDPRGCGSGPHCEKCVLRLSVIDTLENGRDRHQVEVRLQLQIDGRDQEFIFLLSTTRLKIRERSMVLVSMLDITPRKQAEETLRQGEERFKLLFTNVPMAYQSLDINGNIIEVNTAWLQTLGYARQEVIGRNFGEFLQPEWRDHFRTNFPRFKALGEILGIEFEMLKKDGSAILASFTGKTGLDGEGRFRQTHCIFSDVTAQRQAENDLRKLVEAVRQASDGVVVTETDGTITYANPAFEQITGYRLAEILGQTPRLFKSGRQDKAFYRKLWDTILSGQRWTGRMVNRCKDGRLYTADCSITPVTDPDGRIVNFVWLTRDVTKSIRLEERLSQAQKMEAIGTLAGGIAHDFNNILFPMVGFAELLQEDLPPDSPLQDHVNEILHAALRSRDLVQQILAFGRKAERKDKPVRLQSIVKEALKLLRASIPTTIDIRTQIDDAVPAVIADPTHIHQIVMNLATNAYHAMEDQGGTLSVSLEAVRLASDPANPGPPAGPYAHLCVADTGTGMAREVTARVFDPYFTTKDEGKGTGLGLSVVHGIVASYQGDIRITSEPGRGTECHVYLPVVERKAAPEASAGQAPVAGGTERILLVDDEEAIVRMEQQMLTRLGYRVTVRTASIEALEAFKAYPDGFDLLITDMTMPNMTGLQLAREIKTIRPGFPVIICTGFSEKIDRTKCDELGVEGLIMKPVAGRAMAEAIRKTLEGR